MAFTKETAIEILLDGGISEFNEARTYDEDELLDLSEVDFTGFNLTGANLSFADLNGVNFSEMELQGVNFSGSDLTASTFLRANILDSDFTGAILNGAIFVASNCQANFTDADVSGADFSDGDFSESDFTLAVNMSMCKFDKYTVWPDSSNLPDDFDSEYVVDSVEEDDDTDSGNYY